MELNIGIVIRRLRTENGLTQEELADFMGVSFQAVSKWECGVTAPDIALLPRLAMFFGVRIDDLFGITAREELERVEFLLEHETLTDENFDYARKVMEKNLEMSPGDVRVLKIYARLYLSKNQRNRLAAGRLLRRAMEESADDAEIFTLYRQVCGGDGTMYRLHTDDFLRDCEPMLAKTACAAKEKLCELLLEASIGRRDFDKACAVLAEYAKLVNNAMPDVFCGDIELARGYPDRAISRWEAVDVRDHKGQYEAGERFAGIGEYDRAVTAFERSFAAADVPRDLSAMYSLAFLYEKRGNGAKAKETWQIILDVLASDWGQRDGETVAWAQRERDKF